MECRSELLFDFGGVMEGGMGSQHDVQSAVEVSLKHSAQQVHRTEVIAMPTIETLDALLTPGVFSLNNPLGG